MTQKAIVGAREKEREGVGERERERDDYESLMEEKMCWRKRKDFQERNQRGKIEGKQDVELDTKVTLNNLNGEREEEEEEEEDLKKSKNE